MLYIVLFLHQTATFLVVGFFHWRCISFYSYIKPQPRRLCVLAVRVVYRSIPTSNRNLLSLTIPVSLLYIVLFLHQTATVQVAKDPSAKLYIVLFLHQTATFISVLDSSLCCISFYSYIKPQLATRLYQRPCCCISFYSYIKPQPDWQRRHRRRSCISFYSYIKPQHKGENVNSVRVVYRSIPTSNRNINSTLICTRLLYIVLFLHQTATLQGLHIFFDMLYIVLFLHQTATSCGEGCRLYCCISFYSYIKPQLFKWVVDLCLVVYRSIPTSNRNSAVLVM